MIKNFLSILGLILVIFGQLSAQDNLEVSFLSTGIPDKLNICGDPDTVSLRITLKNPSLPLTNIEANWHLFEGIELVEILDQSTPGIVLLNPSNPRLPNFEVPNLNAATPEIIIHAAIRANCTLLDTLGLNNLLQVRDQWIIQYDTDLEQDLLESQYTVSYRDALSVPFFTMDLSRPQTALRVGDCFNRSLEISNSSLDAYVDTLVYYNIQNLGVTVDDILVNGVSFPFTSTMVGPNQVRIEARIAGSYFQNNLLVNGQPGNGDFRFDDNEKITITEVVCLQSCEISANSQHNISWGCYGKSCNTNSVNDFISIGQGEANICINNTQNQDAGYCQVGFTTLQICNMGLEFDSGFGAMTDMTLAIGFGGSFASDVAGYHITGINIGSQSIANWSSEMDLDNLPELASDPDGPGGLEDLDGDGFYDDLGVDQTYELTAFYEFDCTQANTFSPADSCLNNFSTSFNARVDYTDACNDRINNLVSSYYRPTNGNSGFSSDTDTDAFLEGDIFYVRHRENRAVRSFATSCPNGGVFIAKVELPRGINPVIAETRLIKNEASSFNLLSSSVDSNVLTMTFGGPLTQFLTGTYDLVLAFEADCTAELGESSFPLTFEFSCPDCDCHHIWFCDDLDGPWLHSTSPPCPIDSLLTCDDGITILDFAVDRTTFGFLDSAFTVPFPANQANTKVAIPCDEIEVQIRAKVGDLAVSDSLGVAIQYENPDNSISNTPLFLFKEGTVIFYKNGNPISCLVDPSNLQLDTSAELKKIYLDLSSCLIDQGINLEPEDSINVFAIFKLNETGPLPFQFKEIPSFRGFAYAMRNGEKKSCDSFGEQFTVAKTNTVIDFPNSNDFPEGCDPVALDFKIVTVNNGFSDYFGSELRPSVKMDSIRMFFDTAIFDAYTDFSVEVLIPGHRIHGNAFYEIAPLTDFSSGVYTAYFDTLVRTPVYNTASNAPFTFRLNLIPTCRSQSGSSLGNNQYHFNTTVGFQDRYYASFIDDGSCVVERTEQIDQNINYQNPPQLTFTPQSSTDFVLLGDTAVWTFQLCNNSFIGSTGLTWFSLESPNRAVQVVHAEDITNPDSIINLDLIPFGTSGNNTFFYADGLKKASGQSSLNDVCNKIRVKGLVSVCGTSQLTANAGWNCTPFAETDWNPEDYEPCTELTIPLTISTRDPFLEANVQNQAGLNPDICDTSSIEIILRNVDLGSTFDLQSNFFFPEDGIKLIPGSFEIAYPSSAAFQSVQSDPSDLGVSAGIRTYSYDGFEFLHAFLFDEGLRGFNPSNPTDSNEMVLRFKFITDCNFENGSVIEFSFQGKKGCGGPTNFEAGETFPINVSGAVLPPDKEFEISLDPQILITGSNTTRVSAVVENIKSGLSDPGDKMVVLLPADFHYVSGSVIPDFPVAWIPGEPDVQVLGGGREELRWDLPNGLQQGEKAQLSFEIEGTIQNCALGLLEIDLMTLSQDVVYCEISTDTCKINLVSSFNDPVNIIQPTTSLTFTQTGISANCNPDGETISLDFELESDGFIFNNENIDIKIYEDANGNEAFDVGENHEDLTLGAGNGNVVNLGFTTSQEFTSLCQLRLEIDSSGIPLCERYDFEIDGPAIFTTTESQSICLGNGSTSIVLNNSDCKAWNYQWSMDPFHPDVNILNSNSVNPEVEFGLLDEDLSINLIAEVTRGNCSEIYLDTFLLQFNKAPEISIAGSFTIQIGDSTELNTSISGNGPYSINWTPNMDIIGANQSNPVVFPDADRLYTVEAEDANGCTSQADVQVLVIVEFESEISFTDTSICIGNGPLNPVITGGDEVLWEELQGNPQSNALDDLQSLQPTFIGNTPGTYNFLAMVSRDDTPGFTDSLYLNIVLNAVPTVDAGKDRWVCQGDTITFDGSARGGDGNYTFNWTGNYSGMNPEIPVLQSGYFHLTVTDGNGCSAIDSVLMNAYYCPCRLPEVAGTIEKHPDCMKDNGRIRVDMVGRNEDYDFDWTPNVGTIVSENERTDLPVGIYDIAITKKGDPFCKIIYSVFLNPKAVPDIVIDFDDASCGASDGRVGLTPINYKFYWPDGKQAFERDDLAAGSYDVTVVDPEQPDCPFYLNILLPGQAGFSVDVVVNNQPDCGQRNGSVTIDVTGGSGDYSYSWFGGQASRNDLAEGMYNLTVTDNQNPDCAQEVNFQLTSINPLLSLTITDTIHVSCPGQTDGGIQFTVNHPLSLSGQLDTIITDGFSNFTNFNLPVGQYCLQIFDNTGCLVEGACFEIASPEPLSLRLTTYPDCDQDGQIEVEIEGGNGSFLYNWADLPGNDNGKDRSGLSGGLYQLTVTDINGCSISDDILVQTCEGCTIWNNLGEELLQADNCNGTARLCIPGKEYGQDSLTIRVNGQLYEDPHGYCDAEVVSFYSFSNLFDLGNSGPYEVVSLTINGQLYAGIFTDLDSLTRLMNTWNPDGDWELDTTALAIESPKNNYNYSDLRIRHVGFGINTTHRLSSITRPYGYGIDLGVGIHEVVVIDRDENCLDSLEVEVVCTNVDTIFENIDILESDTICFTGIELVGAIDTIYIACNLPSNASILLLNDSCLQVNGGIAGLDTTCIVVCDTFGICDTTILIIEVNDPTPPFEEKVWRDTIYTGESKTICCDVNELTIDGPISSIQNICPDESGEVIQFALDTNTFCVTYTGLLAGQDTACIVFCDTAGMCDTVPFYITSWMNETIYDTIYQFVDTVEYCFGAAEMDFNPTSFYNDCPNAASNNVNFLLNSDSLCIQYDGYNIGQDTACMVMTDTFGNQVRMTFIVNVITPRKSVFCDTIYDGETIYFCPDTDELPGDEIVFFLNDCGGITEGNAEFFENTALNCLEITGLNPGHDTACLVICDQLGVCDTTDICITVEEYLDPPIAIDDCDTTETLQPVVINIRKNDIVYGTMGCPRIIAEPLRGEVRMNPDCSVTYMPFEQFCDGADSFRYELCNGFGCDTAMVKVFVYCLDIMIFTAVSPNRDGLNDVFYIGGIEDKPDNHLRIFNRWGNQVFDMKGYDNSFDGTWQGKELPDGSYFYIFEVDDQGIKRTFNGYLEIFR
jgi:gliding motility-associated-like protein